MQRNRSRGSPFRRVTMVSLCSQRFARRTCCWEVTRWVPLENTHAAVPLPRTVEQDAKPYTATAVDPGWPRVWLKFGNSEGCSGSAVGTPGWGTLVPRLAVCSGLEVRWHARRMQRRRGAMGAISPSSACFPRSLKSPKYFWQLIFF